MSFFIPPPPHLMPIPQARRNVTAPSLPITSSPVPTPAPVILGQSPGPQLRVVKPRSPLPDTSHHALPLLAEIDRLAAACEEHERKIRAIRSGIEHRLFVELPNVLSTIQDRDNEAEQIVTELNSAVKSATLPFQGKLDGLLKGRQGDVQTMKKRTTPWLEVEDPGGGAEGIVRVRDPNREEDGLRKVEVWANEIKATYLDEIKALQNDVKIVTRRRNFIEGVACVIVGVVVLLILWFLHWVGLFRLLWARIRWIIYKVKRRKA